MSLEVLMQRTPLHASLALITLALASCGDSGGTGAPAGVRQCEAVPFPWKDVPNGCKYEISREGSVVASGECNDRQGVMDSTGGSGGPSAQLSLREHAPSREMFFLFELSIDAQRYWRDLVGKDYAFNYNKSGEVDVNLYAQQVDDGSGAAILTSLGCNTGKDGDPVSVRITSAEPQCYLKPYMGLGGGTLYVVHGAIEATCHASFSLNGTRERDMVDIHVEF